MKKPSLFFFILAMVAALLVAGCSQPQEMASQPALQPATPQPTSILSEGTIGTAGSPYGTILVDSRGKTLYSSAQDIPGSGASTCNGECAALWPPISADTSKVTSPLVPKDFGSIIRSDGSGQTTYNGRPLYYSTRDTNPGDKNGEGVLTTWFVVRPGQRVHVAQKEKLGLYLTDGAGKTLYFSTNDTAGTSTCTGKCLILWPAFSADPVSVPSILNTTSFSSVTREDGVKQTAYNGKPLYQYFGDAKPGEMNGAGKDKTWYVMTVPV